MCLILTFCQWSLWPMTRPIFQQVRYPLWCDWWTIRNCTVLWSLDKHVCMIHCTPRCMNPSSATTTDGEHATMPAGINKRQIIDHKVGDLRLNPNTTNNFYGIGWSAIFTQKYAYEAALSIACAGSVTASDRQSVADQAKSWVSATSVQWLASMIRIPACS